MNPSWLRVTVHPKATKDILVGLGPDRFEAWVKAKPLDDQANRAVFNLLVRHLGIARHQLLLVKGRHRRQKVFKILG